MKMLEPMPPTKIFMTGQDSGLVSQINLSVILGSKPEILKFIFSNTSSTSCIYIDIGHRRVEKFTVGPSTSNLANIATCDHTLFQASGKYRSILPRNATHGKPMTFYTVGIVSHSDLITGDKSHQICIVPPDLTWHRTAAVMGSFL
jgi:hypothetical protein